jgi:hypothetical protein
MKIINIFIFILTFMPCFVAAQNWLPVRSGEKYNYTWGDEAIIKTTVWADYISVSPGDSISYLNRLFKKVPVGTCNSIMTRNEPVFLQRELHVTDSSFIFYSPETYVIPKDIYVGENWIFDTANNITASLSQVIAGTILGQPDSIRVILLSAEADSVLDTLKMSKAHGILKFPDFDTSGVYFSLAGLETEGLGMQMPKKKDFYDFQVGDSFEYHKNYFNTSDFGNDFIKTISRYTITNIQSGDSMLTYTKNGVWKKESEIEENHDQTYYEEYGTINEEVVVDFSASSWENLYNGQAIYDGNDFQPVYYAMSPGFNKPTKQQDGNFWIPYFYQPDTLHPCETDYYQYEAVGVGIGQVYFYYQRRQGSYEGVRTIEELKAYRSGDESYGTFTDLNDLLPPEIEPSFTIELYWPGCFFVINKTFEDLDYSLQLLDQLGRPIKEEHYYGLSPNSRSTHYFYDLPKGVYIVRISTDKDVVTKKIVN